MAKVVINAVAAKSGGAGTYVQNLADSLARMNKGEDYLLLVPPKVIDRVRFAGEGVRIVETQIGRRSPYERLVWDQVNLRWILKQERADVLVSSSDYGMWRPPCKQVLLVRNPLFFSPLYLRNFLPKKSLAFRVEFVLRRRLILLSIRFSDLVMTASQSLLNDLRSWVTLRSGKTIVNPFGIPLERFPVTRGEWRGGNKTAALMAGSLLKLLFVSEYSDYKNLTTLLKAILLLRERGVDGFRLLTTADPWQFPEVEISSRDEDKQLAAHPLISGCVNFTGSVSYADIPGLYAQSDIFVFPSMAESFGHPLVEAMGSGLPVVASDIPIAREICGDTAIYFDPMDTSELADKLLLLTSNPELRWELGVKGRIRAETLFDWKDHVARLVKIVEDLAES